MMMDDVTVQTTKPKYWIKTTVDYCPVCGSSDTYRERMPLPKPEDPAMRYFMEEHYDWCDAL